jgi:hypothetical protein
MRCKRKRDLKSHKVTHFRVTTQINLRLRFVCANIWTKFELMFSFLPLTTISTLLFSLLNIISPLDFQEFVLSNSLAKPIYDTTISSKTTSRHAATSTSLSPSNSISVRMAQPSSSHHHRERSERSHHHHRHRSISSTTLLLVLSLILAVLAVMLSLPSQTQPKITPASPSPSPEPSPDSDGLWGYITPKRSQFLAQRERDVAQREAEVARREAELLVGAPGGVIQTSSCPLCPTVIDIPPPPIQTVIKEVVKEAELTPPGWWDNARVRADDIFERELKIAEREREISRREESVNRREHDASRRENWIMEQLVYISILCSPVTIPLTYITGLLETMARLWRKNMSTICRVRSVDPRYHRLSNDVLSSETKGDHTDTLVFFFFSCTVCSLCSPIPLLRLGLGDIGVFSSPSSISTTLISLPNLSITRLHVICRSLVCIHVTSYTGVTCRAFCGLIRCRVFCDYLLVDNLLIMLFFPFSLTNFQFPL